MTAEVVELRHEPDAPAEPSPAPKSAAGGLFSMMASHAARLEASLPPPGDYDLTVVNAQLHYDRTDPGPHTLAMLTLEIGGYPETELLGWFKMPAEGVDPKAISDKALRAILRDMEHLARIVATTDVELNDIEDAYELVGAKFRGKIGRRRDRDGLPTVQLITVLKPAPAPAA